MKRIKIRVADKDKAFLAKYIGEWVEAMSLDQKTGQVRWSGATPSDMITEVVVSKVSVLGLANDKEVLRWIIGSAILIELCLGGDLIDVFVVFVGPGEV